MNFHSLRKAIEDKCDSVLDVDMYDERGRSRRIPVNYEEFLDYLLQAKFSCFFNYDTGKVYWTKGPIFTISETVSKITFQSYALEKHKQRLHFN